MQTAKMKENHVENIVTCVVSGQHEKVLVTHIHSPNQFVVQLKREKGRLNTMTDAIQRHCNSPAAPRVTEVDVGMCTG